MPDIPVQAGDFIPDSAPVAPVAAGTFIPDEIAVGTFVSDAETPQTSAEPYSEYLKKLPESDIVRQFREDTKAGIATDRKLYEDAYALRAGEANWTGSKDLTGRTPDRSVLDVLKAAGSTMWEGFKTQAGEAGSLIANNWAKPGTPEYNRAQQAMGNIVQGMTKGTLEGMHMFDRTASKLYNQLTEWGVTDPKTAASRRRQQFARDVEIEAAYDDLKLGVPAALPGSGGSLPDSRTQFETDPAKVEAIADSPFGDLEVFLPGAAAFSAGRAPVSSAARALEKTAAKQATLAARMAAKPAEYAARIAAATERSVGASPAMRAALAGGGATLLGGDPATAVLAAIVGAETKGDKILKGIRVGAEKVASNLADAGGPLSKFSAAAYRTAASPTAKAIVAGQLANAPFALGAGSEEEFKDALAVGAIASGLGIGGERVRSGLDIRANFFAPHDSPPETRMDSKAFGVSEMLDREHSKVMSEINNSGFNFVEGIRGFLRKKGAGEIYAVSPEGYKAALEELTTLDPALLTSLQGKDISEAAATQGVTLSTKDKNGKPRTVALFVVRDGAPGLGAGHEAVHMLEKTLSKEQLTHIYGKIAAEYGEVGIDNARRKYAQDLGVDPAAMSDEFVLSELFAESGSALLNSVPISQFGPNKGKGWKSTVREIYGLVGEGMRKIGLDVPETAVKQERRGEDGLVYTRWVPPSSSGPKTALGFDPSISGARAVENILQAMALDADVFSSPVETVPTEVSPGDNRPNLPDVREAVPPPVFKKGEKLAGDIFGEDGKVVGKDATILEVFEDDQSGEHKYKILFSSKGKTWEATVPQKSLQSQVSAEAEGTTKSPEQATTPTPAPATSPVLTNTPTSAPTPVPAPASTPVPPKNIHVTPAQQEAFAVKATPETIKANIAVAQAADSLPTHQKQAFETEYYSAKGEVGEDATIREQRRKLADAAEKTGKKNPLRAIYQKIFVPYRYVPGKTPRVFGFSYDKLIQNVDVLRGWAAANDPKMAARLSDSQFANTVRNYLENQSNGYGGEGTVIKMPADARPGSITPVNPNYTPKPVSAEDARLVNLLMGIELPQKSSPASQFAARMARQNGLTPTLDAAGVEVTNPWYLEAVSKGFNPRLLNSVVENLPIDRMTTVLKPRADLQVPAGDLGITRAGFLPSSEDASYRAAETFIERHDFHLNQIVREFEQSKGKKKISWKKLDDEAVAQAWLKYGKRGAVDSETMDRIAEQAVDVVARLTVSTELSGHTQVDLRPDVEEILGRDLTDTQWDKLLSTLEDEKGNYLLSDYGLEPLQALANKLLQAHTPEEKLLLVDRMMNVVHQRGDLAALFIRGGTATLNRIATQGGYATPFESFEDQIRSQRSYKNSFLPATQDLNIGLNVTNGEPNTVEQVLSVLKAAGIEPERYEVKQSGTEPTLIARIPATDDAILAQISDTLKQDAIAVRNPDGTGKLLGPRAAAWGEFNPEFFLKPSAPVEFVGIQEGAYPGQEFELYNLTQDIEGHPEGSTVSRETLEKAGYDVPARNQSKFLPANREEKLALEAEAEKGSEAFVAYLDDRGSDYVAAKDGTTFAVDGKWLVDSAYGFVSDLSDWVARATESNAEEFGVVPVDFNKSFWERPEMLFHATTPENRVRIRETGDILPRNETRGMSNRGVGAAVYTSTDPDSIRDSYGKDIAQIDTGAMKRDGYTPVVEQEPAVTENEWRTALADKVGLPGYYPDIETGMNPDTVVIRGKIPAKYIKDADTGAQFLPAVKVQHSGKPLENSLGEKALNLIHFGGAGIEQVDPRNFGKSGLTPRSEMSGLPRSYFYEQGKVNKSDPVAVRGDVYGAKVSGAKIYDGDTDALGFGDMINREKADTMLQKAGYVGLARSVGKYRQIELFSPTNVQKIGSPTAKFLPASTEKQEKAFKDSKVRGPDGKLLPLFHGTYSDFKKFKKGDLGYHFGTKEAANARIGKALADLNPSELEAESAFDAFPELRENMPPGARGAIEGIADGARTLPVFLDIKNPLRMPDVGPWDNPEEVLFALPKEVLKKLPKSVGDAVDAYKAWENDYAGSTRKFNDAKEPEAAKANKAIREGLKSLGYDGVIYANQFEAPSRTYSINSAGTDFAAASNDSYIAFDNSQIMPAFSQDAKARFLPAAPKPGAKEWITAAALEDGDGRILTGKSHPEIIEKYLSGENGGPTFFDRDGFMTNLGRFVSRDAAFRIAEAAGQLDREEYAETRAAQSTNADGTLYPIRPEQKTSLESDAFNATARFLPDAKVAIPGKGLVDPRETRSYKNMVKHLTPAEADKIRRDTAQDMLDIYNELPADEDFETAAKAGSIKKGWYKRAAVTLQFIFGDDTERFVGLVAAMSPQQSVQENLRMSFKVWADWLDAGRPLETDKLTDIVKKHAQIHARVPNSVRALQGYSDANDLNKAIDKDAKLSGFKVESFRRNLLGDLTPSTNDTWMAQFANIDQALFGTKSGYLAFNVKIRKVADKLDMKPAEVQETVWSFFKTLTEATTVATPAKEVLRNLTESDILRTPEFHEQILTDPQVRAQLERLGFTGFDSLAGNSNPVLARPGSLADIVVQEGGERRRVVLDRIANRVQKLKDAENAVPQPMPDTTPAGESPFLPGTDPAFYPQPKTVVRGKKKLKFKITRNSDGEADTIELVD